jgi:hypothetical protein
VQTIGRMGDSRLSSNTCQKAGELCMTIQARRTNRILSR